MKTLTSMAAIIAVSASLTITPALAQTGGQNSGTNTTVEDILLDRVERVLIEEYYKSRGKKPPKSTSDASDDDDDDDDEDEGEGKKAKKHKNKGHKGKKAKGKGKGGKHMPPGLAKRDRLPPGLEKRIERGEGLPPGLAKRSLPADLEERLPYIDPEKAERVIVDDDVVLIEKGTGIVLDVLEDIIRGNSGK